MTGAVAEAALIKTNMKQWINNNKDKGNKTSSIPMSHPLGDVNVTTDAIGAAATNYNTDKADVSSYSSTPRTFISKNIFTKVVAKVVRTKTNIKLRNNNNNINKNNKISFISQSRSFEEANSIADTFETATRINVNIQKINNNCMVKDDLISFKQSQVRFKVEMR